jgi:hypothetical protein
MSVGTKTLDFLGNAVVEGDEVVCSVYCNTSAMLSRGIITKISPKTAMVTLEDCRDSWRNGKGRRFSLEKIIKINNEEGVKT